MHRAENFISLKEDNHSNKIFRTCGTINNKVYNMIIDSGSSENIILKALVDMMGLSTKKHLASYMIK